MTRKDKLLELLKNDQKNSFLFFALAKEFEAEAEWHDAVLWYDKLILNDPNYTGAYYHLAQLEIRLGNISKAKKIMDDGILVCKNQNANHDLSELQGLKMNLEIQEME